MEKELKQYQEPIMKKIKLEDKELRLITTDGKEIIVNYKINEDEDDDDYILNSLREALRNNDIYFEGWTDFEIKFLGQDITELDFKKIIGIRW